MGLWSAGAAPHPHPTAQLTTGEYKKAKCHFLPLCLKDTVRPSD